MTVSFVRFVLWYGAVSLGALGTAVLAQSPDNEQRKVLFSGPATVQPGRQILTPFSTQTNFVWARIAGNLQAAGGTGNDIRVLVLKNGVAVYDSGRRRSVVMSVDFREPGQYVLVLDNSFSAISPKVVSGTISLVYSGVDEAKNDEMRQELVADARRGTAILTRLYNALKSDESAMGTTQLLRIPSVKASDDLTVNARGSWAANSIVVNRGAFRFADGTNKPDDVMAAILGHELSHIFYRHPGYGSSSQGLKGIFDELRGVTALDRVQEREADILGVRVMCQAGFDPNGALILMDRFIEQDRTASSFMRNHPTGLERRAYLMNEVTRCAPPTGVTTAQRRIDATRVPASGGKSIWHTLDLPGSKWEFEAGPDYLFGSLVLSESASQLGDYDVVQLGRLGDIYKGVQRLRVTIFSGDSAHECHWEFAIEATVRDGRIEGRLDGYPANAKINTESCQMAGEKSWQPITWVPE